MAAVRLHKIASIPGDGIGTETIEPTIRVLGEIEKRLGTFKLEFTTFNWGSERYKELGAYMPEDGLEAMKAFDAILFGAVGSPTKAANTHSMNELDVPDHISLWGLILPLRKGVRTM
ncbi:hypothetical protein O1611_g8091 [Lasiodiplodia mahajangana]|uniref:Uncharacterized protein n=1 Tax=Lasiodiplodia mahajangana TaxID=1108764 RepID=A0ACC2JDP4_9PEZI|nr:hypothetical protein O1611_g8091 [Lasiodiplodia mahajangana]